MNKKEFLDILRESLKGEVSNTILEQNISYYDQYISSQADSERAVIASLGDPRLIARTIIESDKIARQKDQYAGYRASSNDYEQAQSSEGYQEENEDRNMFNLFHLKWYHKVLLAVIFIFIIWIIAVIGRLLISFIFAFAVPIILVLLLYTMFRKRS
jgi:hypothetical protein